MTDVVGMLMESVARQSPTALVLACGVGVLTSAGPCIAPRLASLAGIVAEAPASRRRQLYACFIGGLALSNGLIAISATLLATMTAASTWVYAGLALSLGWSGVRSLTAASHECAPAPSGVSSYGRTFLTGAGYAFVASPCCTPIVAAIAGIAQAGGPRAFGVLVAIAFAVGHAAPLLLGSLGIARLSRVVEAVSRPALATIGGAVMLALCGYYAILV